MRAALELRDLLDQVRELVGVELSLFRAEIGERTSGIPSSLMAVVVGGVLLCVSLGLVLVAASLSLLRFGLPLDLAFLIIAVVAIVISLILLRSGVSALKPSRRQRASRKSHPCLEVSSVAANLATSSEYEAEANRLRAQIGMTVGALRSGLTPSNLASEAASRVGIADLSWGGAFDYASKRHPVPTAIIGLGVALWTMSAVRNHGRRDPVAALTTPLRDSSESIVQSATKVFRERAEAKRREFVDVAQSQVATGATMLSDEIGKKLETIIDRVPGGINVRPLIESSIQVALAAALEGLLRRRSRH